MARTVNAHDLIVECLDTGARVDLDEFGVEYVAKVKEQCTACGSHYQQTHGGWGSICYECKEPWADRCPRCGEAGYSDPSECSFCLDQGYTPAPHGKPEEDEN